MLAVNCVRIAIRAFGNLVNLAWSCPWLRCVRARCVFPVACPFVYVHVLIADCWSCYRRRILWASLGQRDRPAVDRSGLEVSLSSLSLSHQCVQRFFRIYIYYAIQFIHKLLSISVVSECWSHSQGRKFEPVERTAGQTGDREVSNLAEKTI